MFSSNVTSDREIFLKELQFTTLLDNETGIRVQSRRTNYLKDLAAKIVKIGAGNFLLPISLHDCVHYLCMAFPALQINNTEFQVGKSRPRLQPCFGENTHLGCLIITRKKIEYFLNETFR
ncbi:hypothetical protein H5410_047417 [Solanum commersonii]|uniref:Uncharacterized protein n=1 Tax=Solanum commersonii TaxID=4109 RepID=A0A9J5XH85_SOLCO|nr:hypothetical protein H5410_047417 [Solanum commersonii]